MRLSLSRPTYPNTGLVGASRGFALAECQIPQVWGSVAIQTSYYSLSTPPTYTEFDQYSVPHADIFNIIGAHPYNIMGVGQTPDPSGKNPC